MKGIGVISEWNPFHNGHRYLLNTIHQQFPEACVIGIMSGNFVQRGEPAILSKWARARLALENGCDVVVELPMWYATAPADDFATGGVMAASALGCSSLAFGVESPNFSDYVALAAWVVKHPDWQKEMPATVNKGQATLQALATLPQQIPELKGLSIDFDGVSNTLLAFSYAKASIKLHAGLEFLPIERQGAKHQNHTLTAAFTSSTAIRQGIETLSSVKLQQKLKEVVPKETLIAIRQATAFPNGEQWYPYVRYQLLSQSEETLRGYYQMYEGIEHVFKRVAKQALTLGEFMEQVTNRQWTIGRVKRALLMVALGVTEAEMVSLRLGRQPLLLLGATQKGRHYLKNQQELANFPIISRVDHQAEDTWAMWLRGDRIYQTFLNPDAGEQNFGHPPLFVR
ncbi:MAG: nucleotidyltransferase family protein [Aerococcus sp.]|nr:nucleotidyltransferase family protein [Aerococcus sp.]